MSNSSDRPAASEPRNLTRLLACIFVGVALWFAGPPAGLNAQAWHVFAVFAATIVSFLLRPLPMGVCVVVGLLVLMATSSLATLHPKYHEGDPPLAVLRDNSDSIEDIRRDIATIERFEIGRLQTSDDRLKESFANGLHGYGDSTTWLVVAAFLISTAVMNSGLGRRVALLMVAFLGRTTLGLGYAIAGAELLLAPFIPSNTARGGGLMMPIVNSICGVLGSDPTGKPQRAGEYLVLCGVHLNLVTAAMFLTGMAANPLVKTAAADFLDVAFGWGTWLLGSIAPGLVSLAVLPLFLYWLARPQLTDAREAQAAIRGELKELGPWTSQQITMAGVLLVMLVLWATGPLQENLFDVKLPTALVALAGVATLIVLGVLPYHKVIGNAAAWDALLWLGGLITMAGALRTTGFVEWFADNMQDNLGGVTGLTAAIAMALIYFYSMYSFSMLTGHILAFAGTFFSVAAAVGAPPLVMVALIAYFSNLCGCTTNYSTGPVVIYYGLGYVPAARWFKIGFLVSLLHLAIWLGVGLAWWKLIGWW